MFSGGLRRPLVQASIPQKPAIRRAAGNPAFRTPNPSSPCPAAPESTGNPWPISASVQYSTMARFDVLQTRRRTPGLGDASRVGAPPNPCTVLHCAASRSALCGSTRGSRSPCQIESRGHARGLLVGGAARWTASASARRVQQAIGVAHSQQRRGVVVGRADRHARDHGPRREGRWIGRQHRRRHRAARRKADDENAARIGLVATDRGARHLPDRHRLAASSADVAGQEPVETTAMAVFGGLLGQQQRRADAVGQGDPARVAGERTRALAAAVQHDDQRRAGGKPFGRRIDEHLQGARIGAEFLQLDHPAGGTWRGDGRDERPHGRGPEQRRAFHRAAHPLRRARHYLPLLLRWRLLRIERGNMRSPDGAQRLDVQSALSS